MDEVTQEAEVLAESLLDELRSYPREEVAERAKQLLLAALQPN